MKLNIITLIIVAATFLLVIYEISVAPVCTSYDKESLDEAVASAFASYLEIEGYVVE